MRKVIVISLMLFMLSATSAGAQTINWTSFEQLEDSLRTQPKPILIFIEADWCRFCKMQDNTTFRDPELVQMINDNFYSLRLNGESKNDIRFLNRKYQYHTTNGYNELAEILGKQDGELTFPTTVLINPGMQKIQRLRGFQDRQYLSSDLKSFLTQNP